MNTENWTPAGIARGISADLEGYEARAWEEAVAERVPGEFLIHLIEEVAELEAKLAAWKQAAAVSAIQSYGVSQRLVAVKAKAAQGTVSGWKKAASAGK